MELSIIVPVYNEAPILQELNERLMKAASSRVSTYEIIYVNDGSRDQSMATLRELSANYAPAHYINFSRNFGHQIAVTAGLEHCTGQMVVIIDGDLQDPPELIPELIDTYRQGYEVVYAQRKKRQGETYFKKITAKTFYRLMQAITHIDIPLDTGDFRLIDRQVVDVLKRMPEQNKFLRGQIAWMGFRQTAVKFDRAERKAGTTGYTFKKMMKFALDGVTSFSDAPLRLATKLGFAVSLIAFLIILYALFSYFVLERTMTGWTSLIISSTFLGGIQLFFLGVIGEYLSRMNRNLQNRPLYIVAETDLKQ